MNTIAPISSPSRLYNETRVTDDFEEKFRTLKRVDLVLLLRVLQSSDLAREGIANSGSFRFADHLYRNRASGTGFSGRILDRIFLNLPSARAMRRRFVYARDCMIATATSSSANPVEILTVPCGIPRDVLETIQFLRNADPATSAKMRFTGFDLDPCALQAANQMLPRGATWLQVDALDPFAFPADRFHLISSTGLGEFLSDTDLLRFYRNVHKSLRDRGCFFTSAVRSDRLSKRLLKQFELSHVNRNELDLFSILSQLPWRELRFEEDSSGLQTYVYAVK
jgi:SAM-dependent methyltransferase